MSTGIVLRNRQVDEDLSGIADFIARHSLVQAIRFLDAAEKTFRDLATNPQLGAATEFRSRFLSGTRTWRVQGFPNHLIFYLPLENGINVIRVIHGAREIDSLFD